MKSAHALSILLSALLAIPLPCHSDEKLSGTLIGTTASTPATSPEMAFDGDLSTSFSSRDASYTWLGLDLGERHIITRVGIASRNNSSTDADKVWLGVFEGADSPDFSDAMPLHIVAEKPKPGVMTYADVSCSRGFRYVRYVGPSSAKCTVAELEFYGEKGNGDDNTLYRPTNLPLVSIHTLDGTIPYDKEHLIESTITIIAPDGDHIWAETGNVRLRGNYSMSTPKKPYRIKFEKKQRPLDAIAKAKKWTLINNYGDKTLMRNMLAFEVSRLMGMPYTPYATAVDVILNGEYKGCYQLCDQIEVNPNRVDIDEMTPDDNSGENLTGGYLIEVDAYASDERLWFTSTKGTPVTIKSPDEDYITDEQIDYIEQCYNKMESSWRSMLDLNTFLRHFLVGELTGNTDTYWSVYMYKKRSDDMLYTGPVWDFDLAFENDNRTYPINSHSNYIYTHGSYTGYMRSLVNAILANKNAKQQLYDIWKNARESGLTEQRLIAYIDSLEETLEQSQALNFIRWPIMNQYVHQNPVLWGSYEAEVENVRRYVRERLVWIDNKLGYTYDPSSGIKDTYNGQIDYGQPYNVYTLDGRLCGNTLEQLKPGLYVIKQGNTVRKTRIR